MITQDVSTPWLHAVKFPSISAFKENLNEEGKSHFKSFIFEFMARYKKLFF